jgi:site-specific DNA-methyltransferase (adenine-specific)
VALIEQFHNKIFNCDNREIFAQLPDDSIDLIITDPPYKDYQSNRPVVHEKVKKIHERDFDLPFFIEQSARVLKQGAHFYCWCDHLTFPGIFMQIATLKTHQIARKSPHFLNYKNCLVWVKSNHGSGDLKGNYAPQHEFVIFACKGKGRELKGKRQPNVYFKNIGGSIEFYSRISNYEFEHGTSKPVDVQRLMIAASSEEGELVFDPYAGSMSVGEACIAERRKFLLVEIDECHYHNGVQRLNFLLDQPNLF